MRIAVACRPGITDDRAGVLPAEVAGEPAWQGRVRPGDLAVMVGGRIGKERAAAA